MNSLRELGNAVSNWTSKEGKPTHCRYPKRPINSGAQLHGNDAKAIIFNVLSFFKKEAHTSKLLVPLHRVVKRTCVATAIPKKLVGEILQVGENDRGANETSVQKVKRVTSDELGMCALRRQILHHYTNYDQPPSAKLIKDMIKEQFNVSCTKSGVLLVLKKLGFQFCRVNKNVLLLENKLEASQRITFLQKLREYRTEGRDIVFVGSTKLGSRPPKNPGLNPQKRGNVLLVHAGHFGELLPVEIMYKFESDQPYFRMNRNLFNGWLVERLIPSLPGESVIVFQRIPFGGVVQTSCPTLSTKLEDLKNVLNENKIPYPKSASKFELLELYYREKDSMYWLDEIFEKHGHIVLRMPSYLTDLSPIEKVWQTVKDFMLERRVVDIIQALDCKELFKLLKRCWSQNCADMMEMEENLLNLSLKAEEKVEKIVAQENLELDPESDCTESDSESEGEYDFDDVLADIDDLGKEFCEDVLMDEKEESNNGFTNVAAAAAASVVSLPQRNFVSSSNNSISVLDEVVGIQEEPVPSMFPRPTASQIKINSYVHSPMLNIEKMVPTSTSNVEDNSEYFAKMEDFDWIHSDVDPSVWKDVSVLVSEVKKLPDNKS